MLEQEFIALGWKILENKIAYYHPHLVVKEPVADSEFDADQRRYLELCDILGKPNTVVHNTSGPGGMMEVDFTRPSVILAYNKIR